MVSIFGIASFLNLQMWPPLVASFLALRVLELFKMTIIWNDSMELIRGEEKVPSIVKKTQLHSLFASVGTLGNYVFKLAVYELL